ncbi:hypothetical protein PQR33_35530 [Paraburkholderia sediminicola]|uniref:hypothetical protein n=1 Tax=Paraburkholderia sediminicola TaxID=458836 RepID=UPI0038BB1FF0
MAAKSAACQQLDGRHHRRSGHSSDTLDRLFVAEVVSKLETTRFSGITLPFPKYREADTERSGGSTFALDVEVARFDTASAEPGNPPEAHAQHARLA